MSRGYTIGLDIGGTKTLAGLLDSRGRVVARQKFPTPVQAGAAAVQTMIEGAVRAVWREGVTAIGLGMAGLVDPAAGVYRRGPNFPAAFRNIPIAARLRRRFGLPVAVDNDVHCFALAEARYGAARGARLAVGLTLGTGIGGAIVLDGKLLAGRDNAAGEVGHMSIALDGRVCSCGRPGHLEAYSSGNALIARYAELTGTELDAFAIETLAREGEPRAQQTVTEAGQALAAGLANLIQVLNPDIIVIGGGIARLKALWPIMGKDLRRRVAFPGLAATPIVASKLGDEANIIGAALLTQKK